MIRRGAAVNQLSPPIHPRSNALSSSYNPDQHFQHLPSYSTHHLDVNPSRMTITNIQKDSSVIPVHSHETKFTLSQNDHHHGEYAQQRIQRIQRQQHQVHPQSTNTPMIHVVNDLLSSNMEHFSTLNHDQNEPKRYLKLPRNTCDPPSTTHHSDSNYQQHLHSFPNSLMSSSILLSKFRKIHTPKSSSSSFTPLILSQNSVDTKQKYHYPMLKTDHLAITIHPPTGMDIADMKVHPLLPKGRIGSHDNKEVILNNGNTLPISLEKLSLLRSRDKEGNVTNLEKIMSTQAIASCSSVAILRTTRSKERQIGDSDASCLTSTHFPTEEKDSTYLTTGVTAATCHSSNLVLLKPILHCIDNHGPSNHHKQFLLLHSSVHST